MTLEDVQAFEERVSAVFNERFGSRVSFVRDTHFVIGRNARAR